jgi:parallel beta-helix repeat protein
MGGLHISRSSNNNVSHNTITGGMVGEALIIYLSEGNIITSNNITGNMHGLALVGSTKNVLRNNKMTSNWCNFAPWRSFFYEYSWQGPNDVDASNTVDGKPICYWVNVSNRIVPSETGCVVLVNCRNITVENLELRNNFDGVFLVNSNNILIRRNNISHHFSNYAVLCCGVFSYFDSFNITVTLNNITANENGIMLWGYNNTVSYNNIANSVYKNVEVFDSSVLRSNNITNSDKGGLVIEGSGCAVISNNIVSNWGAGITLRGPNHTITLNNIIGNGFCGIQLVLASECLIDQNNIIRNGYYGVWMYSSSNNKIFHNNFINNTKDLNSDGSSANVWDDGYPSGGNYWSSYNGTDNDGDGIGDTPYVLDANNIDQYPLMKPFAENLPPKIYSMKISGWIGDRPIEGYYDTTWPFPGTYIYIENSTVQVDTFLTYSIFVDYWKLDGVNVGSDDFVRILMNQNHNLEVFLSVVPPLSVSISPTKIKTKIGRPVTFTSSVFGGKPPYDYQWYVNEREVLNATSPIWTFAPEKLGNYTIHLSVRCPFSSPMKSQVALVIVVDLLLVGDINDDDKVDIKDLILFIKAFGSYPSHPRWNPNADVNSDGRVDIKDLVLLIKHFGEHYP